MTTNQQTWDGHVDDVSVAGYQTLIPLVKAIHINAVAVEVYIQTIVEVAKLRTLVRGNTTVL